VSVTVEIGAGSMWGSDITVDQIMAQASEEAVKKLRRILAQNSVDATVVDDPRVTVVIAAIV
jgi:hypothetical protein